MEKKTAYGLSSSGLKLIAVVSMLIDHAGYMFFPGRMIFRYMGRLAFPIYCFLLVEGFFYTHSRKKYMGRLFLFAILSEVPFNLAFYHSIYYPQYNNVFFTLCLGLAVMWGAEELYKKTGDKTYGIFCCILGMAASAFLHTDYDYKGILMIYIFYLSWEGRNYGSVAGKRNTKLLAFLMVALVFLFFEGNVENYAMLSLPLLFFYTGEKSGRIWKKYMSGKMEKAVQYLFYVIYPIHLLIYYLIYVIITKKY